MLQKIDPSVTDIIRRLQEAGFEAYIVGGAVRDILLSRPPKDYDLTTSATPEEIRIVFGRRQSVIIGKRFRLVHLRMGNRIIEVSTFRKTPQQAFKQDSAPKYGPPSVPQMIQRDNEYGTAQEDAWRRDFTVNAIFYDPVKDQLSDFTGMGIDDLNHRIVRVIGEPQVRFEEDPVRILRALKLVGQYGFEVEHHTAEAIAKNLRLIEHAAPSRLSLELEKILKSPYGHRILRAFRKWGFLQYFMPWFDLHWQSDAAQYALLLLQARNERVEKGLYRDSVSVSAATLVLPFVEMRKGNLGVGGLWDPEDLMRNDIWEMVPTVLNPHRFCQRVASMTAQIVGMQPDFHHEETDPAEISHRSGYPNARELFLIQNSVAWLEPDAEKLWPAPKHHDRNEDNAAYYSAPHNRPPRKRPRFYDRNTKPKPQKNQKFLQN